MTYSNSWYKKEYLLGLGGLGGGAGGILVAGGPITSSSDGYQIKKSLGFDSGSTTSLSTTVAASNSRVWTWSGWLKRTKTGNINSAFFSAGDVNEKYFVVKFGDDKIAWQIKNDSNSYTMDKSTTAKFRDPSAWYHVVIAVDTNQSDAQERAKLYVNGEYLKDYNNTSSLTQYASYYVNRSVGHHIGRNVIDSNYFDGYIADVQFIDGLQLSPAAFGEFSSTKLWNPISFALPAPNDGTTWSSSLTSSTGSFYSNQEAAKGFDGDVTTQTGSSTGAGTLTFEPTDGIAVKSSVEITSNWNANHLKITTWIDDVKQTHTSHTGSGHEWQKIYEGGGNLTKILIEPPASGKSAEFYGIRVDGVVLIDGQIDPTTRNNQNNGTNWTTGSGYLTRVGNWTEANAAITFDGDLSTTPSWNANYDSAYFKPGWTGIKKIRIYFTEVGTGSAAFSINGTDYKASAAAVGDNAWWTAPSSITTIDTTNGIHWGRVNNTDEFKVSAIEIDGHILIDDAPDNSYHLKFDDIGANKDLGYSQVMNTFTGAHPAIGPGADEDNKSNLVFALPGYDLLDHHHTIKGSGSAKALTVSGDAAVNTTLSRFYGSGAIYFDGTGDHMATSSSSSDFTMGTGDFTVECWVTKDAQEWKGVWQISSTAGGFETSDYGDTLAVGYQDGVWQIYGAGGSAQSSAFSITANQWYHLAYVRSSGTSKLYVDGKSLISQSDTTDYDGTYLGFGGYYNTSYLHRGRIQDLKVYKGVAKYTADFTLPTRNDFTVNSLATNLDSNPEMKYFKFRGVYNSTGYSHTYSVEYSDDNSSWTEAWNGDASTASGACQLTQGTGGGGSYGTHRYWRFKCGSTNNAGGHFPRVSRLLLVDSNSVEHELIKFTTDNCSDSGTIPSNGSTYSRDFRGGGDIFTDSPTSYGKDTGVGGEVRGNFATWNPLAAANTTFSHGNLKMSWSSEGTRRWNTSTMAVKPGDGRFLVEHTLDGGMEDEFNCGFMKSGDIALYTAAGGAAYSYWWRKTGEWYNGSTVDNSQSVSAWADGDVLGVAIDYSGSTGSIYLYKNGTAQNSGNAVKTGLTDELVFLFTGYDTFAVSSNFGDKAYKYPVTISGNTFGAVCTQNLPDTFGANDNALEDKNDPSKYFDVVTYTGEGLSSGETIRNYVGFGPDFIWQKKRQGGSEENHSIHDVIRGAGKELHSNNNNTENTSTETVTAFNSDGWTYGANSRYDEAGSEYVTWLWDAGTAASGANNNGSINIASGDQWVNDTSGFSITKFTGTGADATFGHGQSAAPEFVIIKKYSASAGWVVQHVGNTMGTGRLILDENSANNNAYADNYWNSTAPTSTLIHIGDHANVNTSGATHICYSWRSIPGYSKFGNWTGTGADPGPFIYLGFRPRYFLMKELDDATNWVVYDSERDSGNPTMFYLFPNGTSANDTYDASGTDLSIDFLSNGVKIRNTNSGINASGDTYIYSAFAEHPYKTSRAR